MSYFFKLKIFIHLLIYLFIHKSDAFGKIRAYLNIPKGKYYTSKVAMDKHEVILIDDDETETQKKGSIPQVTNTSVSIQSSSSPSPIIKNKSIKRRSTAEITPRKVVKKTKKEVKVATPATEKIEYTPLTSIDITNADNTNDNFDSVKRNLNIAEQLAKNRNSTVKSSSNTPSPSLRSPSFDSNTNKMQQKSESNSGKDSSERISSLPPVSNQVKIASLLTNTSNNDNNDNTVTSIGSSQPKSPSGSISSTVSLPLQLPSIHQLSATESQSLPNTVIPAITKSKQDLTNESSISNQAINKLPVLANGQKTFSKPPSAEIVFSDKKNTLLNEPNGSNPTLQSSSSSTTISDTISTATTATKTKSISIASIPKLKTLEKKTAPTTPRTVSNATFGSESNVKIAPKSKTAASTPRKKKSSTTTVASTSSKSKSAKKKDSTTAATNSNNTSVTSASRNTTSTENMVSVKIDDTKKKDSITTKKKEPSTSNTTVKPKKTVNKLASTAAKVKTSTATEKNISNKDSATIPIDEKKIEPQKKLTVPPHIDTPSLLKSKSIILENEEKKPQIEERISIIDIPLYDAGSNEYLDENGTVVFNVLKIISDENKSKEQKGTDDKNNSTSNNNLSVEEQQLLKRKYLTSSMDANKKDDVEEDGVIILGDDEEEAEEEPEGDPSNSIPKKKAHPMKGKSQIGKYDFEDPFIDDTELFWEEQRAATKDGFFVYFGPLIEKGQAVTVEKANSSIKKGKR